MSAISSDFYASRQQCPGICARQEPVIHDPLAASQGPLTRSELESFDKDGFLFLPQLFVPSEVDMLYQEMQAIRARFSGSGRPEIIAERDSSEVRSVFDIHRIDPLLARLTRYPRLLNVARQILGGDVYIHQSRINYKPGLVGREFYWHSDFETWHMEDGMPSMRAISCAISLTENTPYNGALMLIPGSHRFFVSCAGETPPDHYQQSLKKQEYGIPDRASLEFLVAQGGITMPVGPAGSVIFFDCNTMHGSNSNISPAPRSNIFMVYNRMDNQLQAPRCGLPARPEYIAARTDIQALSPLD